MFNYAKKVLILTPYYVPGYKAGGPIRTLANMVEQMGEEFVFKIITMDRDFQDYESYPGIKPNSWNRVGKASVFYLSPENISPRSFQKVLSHTKYSVLYLNSFFHPWFTILPLLLRRLRFIPNLPLVLAPRGEFSPGALVLKWLKKRIYLKFAKVTGLYRDVIWQASSLHEEMDIRQWFGAKARVIVAPNLPDPVAGSLVVRRFNHKRKGQLHIVFLSRVARIKNLAGALRTLQDVGGEVTFDIYGPLEDAVYWRECQEEMARLPANVQAEYKGIIEHNRVVETFAQYDFFFLPTLGENFGHVILEALIAGCPVLISNMTPWRDLESKGVGWDVPLDNPTRFQEILQRCVDMDAVEYNLWSKRAREYGLAVSRDEKVLEQNRQLFYQAMQLLR